MTPSARGLFRATGKEPKVEIERVSQDFYATPWEVTKALMDAEQGYLKNLHAIWEPACGTGAMVDVLREKYKVIASDIADRGCKGATIKSFLHFDAPLAPAIVTNPPYSLTSWGGGRARWIGHALDTLNIDYMALLLPLAWLSAAGLEGILSRHPPASVCVLTWRVDFTGQKSPPTNHAWVIWDRSKSGGTVLRRLPRPKRQGDFFQ